MPQATIMFKLTAISLKLHSVIDFYRWRSWLLKLSLVLFSALLLMSHPLLLYKIKTLREAITALQSKLDKLSSSSIPARSLNLHNWQEEARLSQRRLQMGIKLIQTIQTHHLQLQEAKFNLDELAIAGISSKLSAINELTNSLSISPWVKHLQLESLTKQQAQQGYQFAIKLALK